MRVPGPGQRTARTGEMSGGPFLGPSTTCAEMCGGVRVGSEEGDEGGGERERIAAGFGVGREEEGREGDSEPGGKEVILNTCVINLTNIDN